MTFIVDMSTQEKVIYELFQGHQYVMSYVIDDKGKWTSLHEEHLLKLIPVMILYASLKV